MPPIVKSGWRFEARERAKRGSGPATLQKAISGSTPATVPEMTRRVLLLVPLAACCRAADPAQEVIDLVADAAASLSAGSVPRFLKAFDPAMEGYAKLRENVTGLVALGEIQSLIDPLDDEGDDRRRTVQLRWTLRLHRG